MSVVDVAAGSDVVSGGEEPKVKLEEGMSAPSHHVHSAVPLPSDGLMGKSLRSVVDVSRDEYVDAQRFDSEALHFEPGKPIHRSLRDKSKF